MVSVAAFYTIIRLWLVNHDVMQPTSNQLDEERPAGLWLTEPEQMSTSGMCHMQPW